MGRGSLPAPLVDTMTITTGYLTAAQRAKLYTAFQNAFYTAAKATFTLHHVAELPVDRDESVPFDIPAAGAPTPTDISLHAMVSTTKRDAHRQPIGEVIDCDLRLIVWQEEMEDAGLHTTAGELDALTKSELSLEGERYTIDACTPTHPMGGPARSRGSAPPANPWDRTHLAARFDCTRKGRR